MDKRTKQVLTRFQSAKGARSQLNEVFEEIAEVLSPERVGFTTSNIGNARSAKIYDTAPLVAKRALVNAISGMLRPKSTKGGKWFDIVPEDEDLLKDPEVKAWVEAAEDTLWKHMYNPDSRFISALGEIDDDLVTFGTGFGFVSIRPDMRGLYYKAFHPKQCYLEVDGLNEVSGVYVREMLTPSQAAEMFGVDNLGAKTKERLRDGSKHKREEKSEFVWWVSRRHEFDPASKSNLDMPYISLVIDVDSEHEVEETGYMDLPFVIPRWSTMSRDNNGYGRGPGLMALPDVLTLNQMGKTMLRALHRAVDPPWLLPSDSMVNAPQLRPGGVSYYDAKAIRNLGMSKPFQQMDSTANIPWGLDAQAKAREGIMAVFFKNILNLPVDAPQMTATEVLERRESFVREIGSVFGSLESSYTNPLVERSFNILLRKGAFGPPEAIPEALQGSEVQFRFASPVEKAKRQIEEAGVGTAMDRILQIGQVRPEILERFDFDAYGKFIADSNDFPLELMKTDADLQAAQEQQAQQQQMQQQMQIAERLAPVMKQAAEADKAGADAGAGAGGVANDNIPPELQQMLAGG